jgi:hypothetical protein
MYLLFVPLADLRRSGHPKLLGFEAKRLPGVHKKGDRANPVSWGGLSRRLWFGNLLGPKGSRIESYPPPCVGRATMR